MAADITPLLNYLMPIIVLVLAFIIMYAILRSTKLLGGVNIIDIVVSVIIAVIFASISSAREYIQTIATWFVILVVALFFILFILSFVAGKFSGPKWVGIVFIILLALVFLIAAVKVFNLEPYLLGQSESGGQDTLLDLKHWILQDNVLGAILLIIIAAIVIWVVSKS